MGQHARSRPDAAATVPDQALDRRQRGDFPWQRRQGVVTTGEQGGIQNDPALLYAAVQFAATGRRTVARVEILFESAAEANRFAAHAGWDAFGVGPVHFHLPAQPQPARCAW